MRRKVERMRLDIAIAKSPYANDQREIYQVADSFEEKIPSLPNEQVKKRDETFDAVGFELLKMKLRENPRFIVK